MSRFAHWADVLKLRAEITDTAGEIADLRYRRNLWMSPWHENAAYLPP